MQAFATKQCSILSSLFVLAITQTSCGEKSGDAVGKDPRVPISVSPSQPAPQTNSEPRYTNPTVGSQPSSEIPNASDPARPTNPGGENPPGNTSGSGNTPLTPPRPVLTVSINDLHSTSGNFCMSIFASPDGFPDSAEKAIVAECFAVSEKSFQVQIQNLPAGTYAIAGWHDENKDKKLNYNLFGIPKEGLAFSENGKPRLTPPPGPPPFESISFVFGNEDRLTQMKTSYLLDLL
jgi:uncharacterized protein (DUF2141 family)